MTQTNLNMTKLMAKVMATAIEIKNGKDNCAKLYIMAEFGKDGQASITVCDKDSEVAYTDTKNLVFSMDREYIGFLRGLDFNNRESMSDLICTMGYHLKLAQTTINNRRENHNLSPLFFD